MKFTIPLFAAVVLAIDNPLNQIPDCAQGCVGQFLTGSKVAGCSRVDYGCVCGNKDFINKIACCIAPVCDDKGKADTIKLANTLCKAFNVDLPSVVTCNTAASSTTAAASSGSASTEAPSTTASGAGMSTTDSASSASETSGSGSMTSGSGSMTSGSGAMTSGSTTAPTNGGPTNVAGIVGAAAALAFAL